MREERKGQEIWTNPGPEFFSPHRRLGRTAHSFRAVAREDAEAKRVAYEEVGNLNKARQAGDPKIKNFNYEWALPSQDGNPHLLVNARGRDPTFLATHSLKKVDDSVEVSKPTR